jgi:NADH-quinone oxidoreductase subunit G
MPSVTIDDRAIEFEPGESIIQVAERSNVEIPYYCWHPKLSVAANCCMCLVEVENAPKLLPACQTECRDGMVVHTKNGRVEEAQRAVQEFLLINHPIDCPICDQAGECKLQDYYMKFHLASSRMADEKQPKPRLEQLGPYVVYNGERCILCTRCIRFMEEVAGDRQLGVFQRGDRAFIGTFPGQELDNPYSLNTVDVCPVGALTSSVFRFKQRAWNLRRSPSICGGCARGCNVQVDQRAGMVYRLLPRVNDAVNEHWMCDDGRLTYARANDDRLTHALTRLGGEAPREVGGREGLARAVELLGPLAGTRQGIAVAVSLHATCEEAFVLGKLAKEVLGGAAVALLGYAGGASDALLRHADRNPNRTGIARVLEALGVETLTQPELEAGIRGGTIKALVCVGHEVSSPEALAEVAGRLEVMIHVAHATTPLAHVAHVTLPSVAWVQVDGTWINADGRAQRLVPAFAPSGAARPAHAWLADIAAGIGAGMALPSVETIRAEMERSLPLFANAGLGDLGPQGRVIG